MEKKENKNIKKSLCTGNEAVGYGAIMTGCSFYAGYPITPQNELIAFMAREMRQKKRAFVQAESEIAAINMVFGASCTGKRAMTTSSSPGISLMQEGISYLAACKLPAVIVNVMRGGPGLGNIAPSQSDYFQATRGGGHGDYRVIVLAPSTVQECFDLTIGAFDLADRYRNPVMVLFDALLGQMAEAVILNYKSKRYKHNKSWALTGARKRKARIIRSLFLEEGRLEELNLQIQKKYKLIEDKEKKFALCDIKGAEIIFVAYGISFRIAMEAARHLRRKGIKASLFRPVSLWPFPGEALEKACIGKKEVFVFELSYGQMAEDVKLSLGKERPLHFYGRAGGGVFSPKELVSFVEKRIKK